MGYLLWEHSLCLQLGVSWAPLHLDSVFVGALRLWGMRDLTWCQLSVHLGSSTPSWLFLSQGGLFPWVFLQMSPLEQEQDVSREAQVAKEPLSDYRKFGWLLSLGSAAVPRHHPCRPGMRSSSALVPLAGAHPVLPAPHLLGHQPLPSELSAFPALISSPCGCGCLLALPCHRSPGIVLCLAASATAISGGESVTFVACQVITTRWHWARVYFTCRG